MNGSGNSRRNILHNGIKLPDQWPPRDTRPGTEARTPPYLEAPPQVITIDRGRQLFVDDFLIDRTDLERRFHRPVLADVNPVLAPETELELNGGDCPVAAPFNDGLFYDPQDKLFKMWYQAGWYDGVGYAVSEDGINWERPNLDVVPGTNRVLPVRGGCKRDGASVWLDHYAASPAERFKMFVYSRDYLATPVEEYAEVFTSPDGIHWSEGIRTGPCGDNTSFYYDPFRKVWVYSIRKGWPVRQRFYYEHQDFIKGAKWVDSALVFWADADSKDIVDPAIGDAPQLYDLNAVGYESLMLGLFAIFEGPSNEVCGETGQVKINELVIAYSRNGFHWDRPDREAFIGVSRNPGDWNYGYAHATGGTCLIVGDKLYFYFGAWSGVSPKHGKHMYAGGSTGLAILRRDGFASMRAGSGGGALQTRPVQFSGRHLFVNADATGGELRVEICDTQGRPIEPFTTYACVPVRSDSTAQTVRWASGDHLSALAGKPVTIRFHLTGGELYSFWVSPDSSGASHGYVGAGGPGFDGPTDTTGA